MCKTRGAREYSATLVHSPRETWNGTSVATSQHRQKRKSREKGRRTKCILWNEDVCDGSSVLCKEDTGCCCTGSSNRCLIIYSMKLLT